MANPVRRLPSRKQENRGLSAMQVIFTVLLIVTFGYLIVTMLISGG